MNWDPGWVLVSSHTSDPYLLAKTCIEPCILPSSPSYPKPINSVGGILPEHASVIGDLLTRLCVEEPL